MEAFGESRTVEIGVFGNVDPVVVDGISLGFQARQFQPVAYGHPFPADDFRLAVDDAVEIIDIGFAFSLYAAGPMCIVRRLHPDRSPHFALVAIEDIQGKSFARGCQIVDVKV